jgi:hypothetical protein
MLKVDEFRNGIAALLGNGLPECVNLDDYLGDFPAAWTNNPARAFLRLSDEDQRKVWRGITDNRRRPR